MNFSTPKKVYKARAFILECICIGSYLYYIINCTFTLYIVWCQENPEDCLYEKKIVYFFGTEKLKQSGNEECS
jgi:hypothetical protein